MDDRSTAGGVTRVPVTTGCVALALGFIALALAVHHRSGGAVGDSLDAHLVSHPGTLVWRVASIVSDVGAGPVVGVVAVVIGIVFAARHRLLDGAVVVIATATAGVIEVALKAVVGRNRPVTAVLSGESGQGFPSGHVSGLTALVTAVVIVLVVRRHHVRDRVAAVVVATLLVAAMAWSRLVVGVHYFTDTLGGALLGAAIALATVAVAERFEAALRAR